MDPIETLARLRCYWSRRDCDCGDRDDCALWRYSGQQAFEGDQAWLEARGFYHVGADKVVVSLELLEGLRLGQKAAFEVADRILRDRRAGAASITDQ